MALVHRPPDEPEGLVAQVEDKLVARYQPNGPGELEVVRGMSGDLIRMRRIGAAECAAVGLAQLEIKRSDDDNQLLLELEARQKAWTKFLEFAQRMYMALAAECATASSAHKSASNIAKAAVKLFGEDDDWDTSVEGAETAMKLSTELSSETWSAKKTIGKVVRLCRASIKYLKALRARVLETEADRHRFQRDLAEIPDEKTVRRFDKYRSAMERSMLRRIEILKGLRELGVEPDVVE